MGFIKCNTLLFGAIRSQFGANTTGTHFLDNSPKGLRTQEMEKLFESAHFLYIF